MFFSNKNLVLLGLLLLSTFSVNSAFDDCGYHQKLVPGRRYDVVSPEFSHRYPTSQHCKWYFTSDTRIKLTCNRFDIIHSPNCQSDFLQVFTNPALPELTFCNRRYSFDVESDGREMIIIFKSAINTPGGSFKCFVEATEEKKCKCGWKNSPRPSKNIILRGIETGVNEYPMMAVLVDTRFSRRESVCGATIISERHLLTAAHCFYSFKTEFAAAVVGEHDLSKVLETNATNIYRVLKSVHHPLFNITSLKYDIAIVTIDGTMTFSKAVGPACLPFYVWPDDIEDSPVDVLGWGTTALSGAVSNVLLKARKVIAINAKACKKEFPNIDTRQMCTFGAEGEACQRDSGGPILWQNPTTGTVMLVGIISYGSLCGDNSTGVNTFVGAYLGWISEMTPGMHYCQTD